MLPLPASVRGCLAAATAVALACPAHAQSPEADLATVEALAPDDTAELGAEAMAAFGCSVSRAQFETFRAFAITESAEAIGVTVAGEGTPVQDALDSAIGDGFEMLIGSGRVALGDDGTATLRGCDADAGSVDADAAAGTNPVLGVQSLSDETLSGLLIETIRLSGCEIDPIDDAAWMALFYELLSEEAGVDIRPEGPVEDAVDARMGQIAPMLVEDGTLEQTAEMTIALVACDAPADDASGEAGAADPAGTEGADDTQ